MGASEDVFRAAMEKALFLLKFRSRSRAEMAERLARKGVPANVAGPVIERLQELRLLDDAGLARGMVRARRHQGDHRLRRDLRRRGLSPETVEEALNDTEGVLPAADRVWAALQKRAPRVKEKDPRAARRRLEGYLFRQGFDAEDIRAALRRYFMNSGEPDEPG